MAGKHFLIYYHRGAGTFVVTEPRPSARENQNLFLDYDFAENFPTTNEIENQLENQFGFNRVIDNDEIILLQNLSLNLEI
ncbi:MAG: hypothetical protein EBR35_03585 [Flavobacteriales bacterium]|nr:hypothetical protein [Flavobacteriales bacterium]